MLAGGRLVNEERATFTMKRWPSTAVGYGVW